MCFLDVPNFWTGFTTFMFKRRLSPPYFGTIEIAELGAYTMTFLRVNMVELIRPGLRVGKSTRS